MDTLSSVLNLVRLKGCVYFLTDFSAPWGMNVPAGDMAQFHLVVRGQCRLKMPDEQMPLSSGDIVVFPLGDAHEICDRPETSGVPGMRVLEAYQHGQPLFQDGEESATLLCGHFEFDRGLDHPLLRELPRLIRIKGMSRQQPGWLESVMSVLVKETGSDTPGSATIVDRLAEVLFIQILRAYVLQENPPHGFLAALQDRRLSNALQIIHTESHRDLTLAAIAKAAGMSRSNLAIKFKDILGQTPMAYLTNWRMLRAKDLLGTPGVTLADIASRVGYTSEAAFSRAFKRIFEQNPGAFRRSAESDP